MEKSSYLSVTPSATPSNPLPPDSETVEAIKRLQQDLSGPSVTAIADQVVKACGSPTMPRINGVLNSWATTWNLRNNHDNQREYFFKGDPLPFWWLAKLYLVLHYHAHILTAGSDFATPRAVGSDRQGKLTVQRKIVGWLSGFRGQRCSVDWSAESWLPDLMKPSQE
jgi:hypothetical protein